MHVQQPPTSTRDPGIGVGWKKTRRAWTEISNQSTNSLIVGLTMPVGGGYLVWVLKCIVTDGWSRMAVESQFQ